MRRRRRPPLFRTVGALALTLVVAAGLAFAARIDRVVVARGALAGGSLAVRSPLEARVEQVLVAAGETVETGDPLVRLDTRALEARLASLAASREALASRRAADEAEIARLVDQVHPADLQRAALAVERAVLQHDGAGRKAGRLREIGESGLVTALEVEQAELDLELARVALTDAREAQARVEVDHAGAVEELRAALESSEGELRAADAELSELRRLLADSTVRATAGGVVSGTALHELAGRAVARGEELCRIASAPADRFEGWLVDSGRARVGPGLAAHVRLEGYPWMLHGTVPARVATLDEQRRAEGGFAVVLDLVEDESGDSPGPLYEGMRGEARIVVEESVSIGRLLFEKLVGKDEP